MDRPVVVGFDFGGTKIAVAVAEPSGARLGTASASTDPAVGARANLGRGIQAAKDLLSRVANGRPVVALGACTFGIPAADGIDLAPAIPGWEELSLAAELTEAFPGTSVRVATDVKAAAAAEAAGGALAGFDPAIYVNLGTGLAVAIVVGGEVLAGANGAAGEIGYALRQPSDVDVPRRQRPVLEGVVSGMALSALGTRLLGRPVSAADVFTHESSPGSPLAGALDGFIRELSFQLVNLTIAIDPARIAVGGGMVRSWHRLVGPLRAALDTSVPYPPELVVGAFPYDAALVGALSMAIEAGEAAGGLPPARQLGAGHDGGQPTQAVLARDGASNATNASNGKGNSNIDIGNSGAEDGSGGNEEVATVLSGETRDVPGLAQVRGREMP